MIKALFGLKDHLHALANKNNQKLVDYLTNKELDLSDEELEYPDTTEISKDTGLPRPKVASLIQRLYTETLEHLSYDSLHIKEAVQILHIHFPYDEESTIHKNKDASMFKFKNLWLTEIR